MKNSGYSLVRKIAHCAIALGMSAAPSFGYAQQDPGPGADRGPGRGAPVGDLPGFIALGPKVGERLPDLSIFNDMGEPVSIRDLTKGSYAVMVLGCLT